MLQGVDRGSNRSSRDRIKNGRSWFGFAIGRDPVPCFNASVIHTGDVEHGGTLKGVIAAVGSPLAQANEDTRIIPGHRALDDLEAERGNGNFNGDRWIAVIYDVI